MEYLCTTDERKITSVLIGLWGKAATKPVGPGFDGSEFETDLALLSICIRPFAQCTISLSNRLKTCSI